MNTSLIRQQHLEYDRFFTKYIFVKFCPFTNIYQYKKAAFVWYRFLF